MQKSKGKREEGGPENGVAEQWCDGKDDVGKNNQAVMQRHGALPSETAQKCGALIFLVGRKRYKVEDQKICEGKRGQWNDDDCKQAMIFLGLQKKADGRNYIGKMRGKSQFTKSAVEQADGRDSVGKDKDEGESKKEKEGSVKGLD